MKVVNPPETSIHLAKEICLAELIPYYDHIYGLNTSFRLSIPYLHIVVNFEDMYFEEIYVMNGEYGAKDIIDRIRSMVWEICEYYSIKDSWADPRNYLVNKHITKTRLLGDTIYVRIY